VRTAGSEIRAGRSTREVIVVGAFTNRGVGAPAGVGNMTRIRIMTITVIMILITITT
jgi:hypothetical protein